jgi:SOS-response transcriptional repressor LexA
MLTPKQKRLLDFIADSIKRDGFAPTFAEMQASQKLSSKSQVHYLLTKLEQRGYISRLANMERAIQVLRRPGELTEAAFIAAARGYLPPDQFAAIVALAHGSAGIAADLAEIMEAHS